MEMVKPGAVVKPGELADPALPIVQPSDPNNCDPCKGLRNKLEEHREKLKNYIADPSAYDNKGKLGKGYDDKIISGRIKKLQIDIENFEKEVAKCEYKNGMRT